QVAVSGLTGAPAALDSPQPRSRPVGVVFGGPPGQDNGPGGSGSGLGMPNQGDPHPGGLNQPGPIIGAGGPPRRLAPELPRVSDGPGLGASVKVIPSAGARNQLANASTSGPAGVSVGGATNGWNAAAGETGRGNGYGKQVASDGLPHLPTPIPTSTSA